MCFWCDIWHSAILRTSKSLISTHTPAPEVFVQQVPEQIWENPQSKEKSQEKEEEGENQEFPLPECY